MTWRGRQFLYKSRTRGTHKDLEILIGGIRGNRDRFTGILYDDGTIGGLVDDQNLGLVPS